MKKKPNDFLGLRKVEDDLNKSLDFEIFKESGHKKKKKFPTPKPRYTTKTKSGLSKSDIESGKKFLKETKNAFGSVISAIKNRKIRKLEKDAKKKLEEAEQLAHEIKTLHLLNDSMDDVQRYKKEKEKITNELNKKIKDLKSIEDSNHE